MKTKRIVPIIMLVMLGAACFWGCGRRTGVEPENTQFDEREKSVRETPERFAEEEPERVPDTEEYGWENRIIIATDIHYLASSLTDGGPRFQQMVENGDGKAVNYIVEITDAFLNEVVKLRPRALILSGDLTLDGERESHKELAGKLYKVKEAGIPVLVIPGNHDINNRRASRFQGTERSPAEYITPEQFRQIYGDFGYNQSVSRDARSLSYAYDLDENNRFLMLDTCQYYPTARVGGAIASDTYDWIEQQLECAWEEDKNIIPVAHHNLLDESEIYVDDCTIEHGEQLVEMLEMWNVPLFLSGHLHVQHNKRSDDGSGIWEFVTSSLATPACQYGVLTWDSNGSFTYKTWSVDVEKWAADQGSSDVELLNFNKFKGSFLRQVFYNQSIAGLNRLTHLTDNQRMEMSHLYSKLNYHYYQGTAYQIKDEVLANPAYQLWIEEGTAIELGDYVQYILEDAKRDYNWGGE